MAIFSDSMITSLGHVLLSKVLSGKTDMKFTAIKAGDGFFDGDVYDLTDLVHFRLDGKIVGVRSMGRFTELDCLLTNEKLKAYMDFREVAIMANDPDLGDIVFAYANAGDHPDPIGPYNGVWLHEELFTIRVFTANVANITATITPSFFATEISYSNSLSGLKATSIQDAIDEIMGIINGHIRMPVASEEGVHNLRYWNNKWQSGSEDGEWENTTGNGSGTDDGSGSSGDGTDDGFRIDDKILWNVGSFGVIIPTDRSNTLEFNPGLAFMIGSVLILGSSDTEIVVDGTLLTDDMEPVDGAILAEDGGIMQMSLSMLPD